MPSISVACWVLEILVVSIVGNYEAMLPSLEEELFGPPLPEACHACGRDECRCDRQVRARHA
jgi:hypothetical protein